MERNELSVPLYDLNGAGVVDYFRSIFHVRGYDRGLKLGFPSACPVLVLIAISVADHIPIPKSYITYPISYMISVAVSHLLCGNACVCSPRPYLNSLFISFFFDFFFPSHVFGRILKKSSQSISTCC